jgi:hypothetical protein
MERKDQWRLLCGATVIAVTDCSGTGTQGIQGTGTFMRELFILCTVVFALVSAGTATVVATALASEPAMAVAVR